MNTTLASNQMGLTCQVHDIEHSAESCEKRSARKTVLFPTIACFGVVNGNRSRDDDPEYASPTANRADGGKDTDPVRAAWLLSYDDSCSWRLDSYQDEK